jgi:replication factor C subunit 2/4
MQLRHKVRPIAFLHTSPAHTPILNRIIEPLASRCSKFRFTPLDPESASSRLTYIAKQEKIDVDTSVIDALITVSNGDLRRAITYLQSASRLSSFSDGPENLRPHDIQEIAGVVPDSVINHFARTIGIEIDDGDMNIDVDLKSNFTAIQKNVKAIIREGYSATQILTQVSAIHHDPYPGSKFALNRSTTS